MLLYAVLAVILAVFFCIRQQFSYWKRQGVPFVEPSFPLGNLSRKRHLGLQIQSVYQQLKGSGKNFGGMFVFLFPTAVALDLDFVKDVLVKDFQHFHDRGLYYNEEVEPLTSHLVSLEGSRWRNLRTKLRPTFSSGKLKMMFGTMTDVAEELVKYLTLEAHKGEAIEIKEISSRFTTDIIGSCAFGLECNSLRDPEAKFRTMGRKAMEVSASQHQRRLFGIAFKNLATKLRMKTISEDVADFFMNVVCDTVQFREKNCVQRNDFMDVLIKMKIDESSKTDQSDKLTLDEIAAQAYIFILAGFETSSIALAYCLFELAQNQQLQEKARQNVKDVLAQHGSMTYEAIHEMTFVENCVDESLRKHPPVPQTMRKVTKDYHIPDMGVTLEKGRKIMIPIYAIHHDPQYYPDPEVFDPDRFKPEQVAKRHPMAFIPFGEGPRICIGLRFGMMQACVGLAYLLNNFRFTVSSKTKLPLTVHPTGFVADLEGGLWLHVEKL